MDNGVNDRYGSDVIAEILRALGLRYASMNPGASWRGLQNSLVEDGSPELIMTLAENVAVAVAHGYAKAAGEPMAAILHDMVGLQSGSMGIFNAWVDSVPMMVLGGSGPADATHRRPWIDWIHSARHQGLIVRDFTKWDDEPRSIEGVADSLVRAHRLAMAAPQGPTYVAFDALLQEEALGGRTVPVPQGPYEPPLLTCPTSDLEAIADALVNAERPVILADSVGRSREGYEALIALAETVVAPVVDLGTRHNFPAGHPLDQTLRRTQMLAQADVVVALDVRDLQWALSTTDAATHTYEMCIGADTKVVGFSLTELMHRGFMDREALVRADRMVTADSRHALPALVEVIRARDPQPARRREWADAQHGEHEQRRRAVLAQRDVPGIDVTMAQLVDATWGVVKEGPWLLSSPNAAYSHVRSLWQPTRWNCSLGRSGGAGLGYGLGAAIGAGLAHRDDDTLVVDIQPDGDAMYTASALWTAARHRIPVLFVVHNNRTYGQDLMHQSLMAEQRDRNKELAGVGIDIDDPEIDFRHLALAQGVEAWGPVRDRAELDDALARAARVVRQEGRPALVDVVVDPGGGS